VLQAAELIKNIDIGIASHRCLIFPSLPRTEQAWH